MSRAPSMARTHHKEPTRGTILTTITSRAQDIRCSTSGRRRCHGHRQRPARYRRLPHPAPGAARLLDSLHTTPNAHPPRTARLLRVLAFRLLPLCGDRSARRRSAGTFCLIIRLNGQLRQIFPPPAPMSLKPRRPRRSRPPSARYDGNMNQCAGLLFAGKRGTGPWAAHGGGAIDDRRPMRAPQLGTARSTELSNRGGP